MCSSAIVLSGLLAGAGIMIGYHAYGWPAAASLLLVAVSYLLWSVGRSE